MNRSLTLTTLVAVVVIGCSSSLSSPTRAVPLDAGARRDTGNRTADLGGPDSGWTVGETWSLPIHRSTTTRPVACGAGIPFSTTVYYPNASQGCIVGSWLYMGGGGYVSRVNLHTAEEELLLGLSPDHLGAWFGCLSDGVVFGVGNYHLDEAIIRFGDVTQPGRVVWGMHRPPSLSRINFGGMDQLVATDSLIAWSYSINSEPPHLYVSDPEGHSVQMLSLPYVPLSLQADGPHLVLSSAGDIWMYTSTTGRLENLTADDADQSTPWISGDRVVWVDERDTPGASVWHLDNPEIYELELSTRTLTRLTHDTAQHPVVQYAPMISGDWVVWVDLRHARDPNPVDGVSNVSEIYGMYLPTRQEFPIAAGDISTTHPTILGGRVYYTCGVQGRNGHWGTYVTDLPAIGDSRDQ